VAPAPSPLGALQRRGRDLRSIGGAVLVQDRDGV
jgi:hypothetical protein